MSNLQKAEDHTCDISSYLLRYWESVKVWSYFFFNTSLEKQAEGENIQASRHNGHAANIGDFFMEKHG